MIRTHRLPLCLLSLVLFTGPVSAMEGDWYLGAGGGVSRLAPDTEGSGFTLDESTSGAFGVFGGWEFGDRYAAELGATRLGEAGLSDGEAIEYSVLSGGVLAYVLGDIPRVRRGEGAGGFLRLGLGAISNASDVPLEKEDNVSVWAAFGADVPVARRWALRAELTSFDGDAQAATVAIVWRPRASSGGRLPGRADRAAAVTTPPPVKAPSPAPVPEVASRAPAPAPVPTPRPKPAPAPAPKPAPKSAPTPASTPAPVPAPAPRAAPAPTPAPAPAPAPRRSVAGNCPMAAPGVPVDERGCARFDGVLDGVGFASGTARLTDAAVRVLQGVAVQLIDEPDVVVEIRAHVAAGGDPAAEKTLSRDRAIATARELAAQGVPIARLRARAFGAENPRGDGGPDERIELGTVVP